MDESAEAAADQAIDFVALTAEIVSAYVSKNSVRPADLPDLLASVHAALTGLGKSSGTEALPAQKLTPAQIRKSITPDALISFIDGKPYRTSKRHLNRHGLTIEEYRTRYGQPRDYPSTAASYSAQRSALARSFGLGQQRKKAAEAANTTETAARAPKKRGRQKSA